MDLNSYTAPHQRITPAGVEPTLRAMDRLVDRAHRDVAVRRLAEQVVGEVRARDTLSEAVAVRNWVAAHVRYTRDPVGAELVKEPAALLRDAHGDCDDMAVLVASLCGSLGHRWRLVAAQDAAGGGHVWAEVLCQPGVWVALDPVAGPHTSQMLTELGARGGASMPYIMRNRRDMSPCGCQALAGVQDLVVLGKYLAEIVSLVGSSAASDIATETLKLGSSVRDLFLAELVRRLSAGEELKAALAGALAYATTPSGYQDPRDWVAAQLTGSSLPVDAVAWVQSYIPILQDRGFSLLEAFQVAFEAAKAMFAGSGTVVLPEGKLPQQAGADQVQTVAQVEALCKAAGGTLVQVQDGDRVLLQCQVRTDLLPGLLPEMATGDALTPATSSTGTAKVVAGVGLAVLLAALLGR